ncbi:MAG: hypothetical protein JXB50_03315 [Spirochaetes bacterium]|nr:hypothetical protein [Spirochaetota bacterium]
MNKKFLFIIYFIILTIKSAPCTLWSANGENIVLNGGTLIAKNRDWKQDHKQILKLVNPKSGYKYFGLFAVGNNQPGLKAGVNEKGLVAITATAGSIPSNVRKNARKSKSLLSTLLKECDSVDAALQKQYLFLGPRNLMIADKTKIASIEIGLRGKYSIKVMQNNILYHTNHYVEPDMLKFNKKISESSLTRFKRIEKLLNSAKKPFTFDDFISISNDNNDGPDNSIYRTGSKKNSNKTVAVWIIYLFSVESSKIYIKINNPEDEEKIYIMDINEIFKMDKLIL